MRVFLRLKDDLLTDYCKYLFPPDKSEGPCIVNGSHPFGKLLISHCRTSGIPIPHPEGSTVLEFELPINNTSQSLNDKFLYYSKGDTEQLNAGLRALFDIDLHTYYLKAESLGYGKKHIIEAFVTSRKLYNSDPEDAISKRIYRRESDKRQKYTKLLLRRIYYLIESIDNSGL